MGGKQFTLSLSVLSEFTNFLGESKAAPCKTWRGGALESHWQLTVPPILYPRALPAGSPLPHLQGARVKVTTFQPELGSVCSGRPQRMAVSGCC